MGRSLRIAFALSLLLALAANLPAKNEDLHKNFAQAEKSFQSGDFVTAQALYLEAQPQYKSLGNLSAYIQNQIAFCLRYQKKTEEAITAFQKVKQDYPNSPLAQKAQEAIARTYYEAGDYAKAGPEFEKLGTELEAAEQKQAVEVKAAAVGAAAGKQEKPDYAEKKNEAYGYAAFCYSKTSGKVKAAAVAGKMKETGAKVKGHNK
jgi:tetratricopeptide (TPR) repeat protein